MEGGESTARLGKSDVSDFGSCELAYHARKLRIHRDVWELINYPAYNRQLFVEI